MEVNKIYHMDCLDGIKQIETGSTRIICSDPPYFLGMTHNGQRGSFVDLAICKPFFKELFKEYKRILRPDGEVYFFCDWRGYAFYYPLFDAILGARNLIVWDKVSGAGNFYAFVHEFILFHCVSNQTNKKGLNIWRSPGFAAGAKKTNGEKVHGTQKTLEIIEEIVLNSSQPGDLIVDTFGGSGTTAVVCRKYDRPYIVFELDEDNIDIAHKRGAEVVQAGMQFPTISTEAMTQNAGFIDFQLTGDLDSFAKHYGPIIQSLGLDMPTAQAMISSLWQFGNKQFLNGLKDNGGGVETFDFHYVVVLID